MKKRKYGQHDRHGDKGRSRDGDKHHVDDEAYCERSKLLRPARMLRPQESHDWIGKGGRAQGKFLALVNIVFNRNSVCGPDLRASLGSTATIHDITINNEQEARNAIKTHMPRDERSK